MNSAHTKNWAYLFFIVALTLNIAFWLHSKKILPEWGNVPSPPSAHTADLAGFGDDEIAYRLFGYVLQNLGNAGGQYRSLRDYDYAMLEKWFFISKDLDPRANYVPFLAAYYFGGVEERPEKLTHVINYLAEEGVSPYPEKWRWLAQAVYLARYKQKDMGRALELANTLANLDVKMAPWARQLPAFIQLQMGNKEASYEIMIRMLATESENLHPNEVNYMRDFICTRTLDKDEAARNPLCKDLK